jgi:hypothetical protein
MNFKRKQFEIAIYLARPAVLSAWWQKSAYYKRGFVVRLLWLGFVLRYGAVPKDEAKRTIRRRYLGRTMRVLATIPDTDGYEPTEDDIDEIMVNHFDPEWWK